jgi:hypothetical protein
MRKILAAAAVASFFAVAAYAGEVEGTVQGVDVDTRTILLEDGTSYVAAESIDLDGIEVGSRVKVTYDDASMQATMIESAM